MTDLNKLVDDLSALSVLQAAELSKLLEDQVGRFRRRAGCRCRSCRAQAQALQGPPRLPSRPNST